MSRKSLSKKQLIKRTVSEARMFIDEELTYQDLANRFDVSVATIYKDLQLRLPKLDPELYKAVCHLTQQHQLESASRAVKARKKKISFIKKNFDFSIFDK